ncbi:TetR family transcriptional regulator [Actinoplanes sp. N902-109]|nr:TetR family transcriptional regulator [Actinoplanes sp. N902-109]
MTHRTDVRARIIDVAVRLLRDHGPAALTTRAVAEAAGVQPPAIYRLFGDKDGLLEAVAEQTMAGYVAAKAALAEAAGDVDPLDDLHAGWRMQIDFAIANPALFRLFSDPDRVRRSPAARAGRQILAARVHRVAETGRLHTSEQRAVDLIQAAAIGTIQTLLAAHPDARDPTLPDTMYAAVLRQLLTAAPDTPEPGGPEAHAVALRAATTHLGMLTDAERHVLTEWLDRIIDNR